MGTETRISFDRDSGRIRVSGPGPCPTPVRSDKNNPRELPRVQDHPKYFLHIIDDGIGKLPTPMKINTLVEVVMGLCKELDIAGIPSCKTLKDLLKDN